MLQSIRPTYLLGGLAGRLLSARRLTSSLGGHSSSEIADGDQRRLTSSLGGDSSSELADGGEQPGGIESFSRTGSDHPHPIHILGITTLAKFMAHTLAGVSAQVPVTMITNRLSVLRNWEIEGKAIRLIMDEAVFVRRHLNIQLAPGKMPEEETDRKWSSATVEGPISQLVVAALPSETVGCLLDIKHLLDRRSTILLVQQGAGVLELINEHVFPDPAIRPAYMLAFLSHGVYGRAAHFSIRLSGSTGITRVTTVPRDITGSIENDSPDSTMWMIDALKRAPGIHPYFSPYLQYLGLMYKKLAVQAVLEPLSTIFEFRYNELASNLPIVRLVRLLLAEISLVLRSLPELQAASHRDWQFDPGRLERNVWEVAEHIQTSVSPMLRETQDARKPQIYFLNGYFVQRGQELGIRCLTNYMVMQMVLAKYVGNRQRKQSDIPMQ